MQTVRPWRWGRGPSRAELEARNAQLTAELAAMKRRFQTLVDAEAQEPQLA